MLTPATIAIVKATAPAVAARAEDITRHFYRLMFAANPEVQSFFNPAHQASGGQQKALAGAICAYAAHIDQLEALGPAVELIAQKHCSLGIAPEHYPIVGRHLLTAIRDVLGEAATDEVLAAWEEAYGFLAKVLIGREDEIYRQQATLPGGWNGFRPFVVVRKVVESELITSFHLQPADGGKLLLFRPGQYITVRLGRPDGSFVLRNYSLSDRPGQDHYRISVKREQAPRSGIEHGLVSGTLHDELAERDVLHLGPPCGEFFLDRHGREERPVVLLSAGVGITPVLSMFSSLAHQQDWRPVHFIHAARNGRVHAMADEVRQLARHHGNAQVQFVYDQPDAEDIAQGRCDRVGLIDGVLLERQLADFDADFYFCGPAPFMKSLYHGLRERGIGEDRLHFEFFGPRQDITAATPMEAGQRRCPALA